MTGRPGFAVRLAAITLIAALPLTVYADLQFSGFGSTSLSCFSSNKVDYVVNDQPEGVGRSAACDTGLDSLLGMQFDVALSTNVELGLQVVFDRNVDRSFDPDINVAQVRWFIGEDDTLRAGRAPTSSFLHAESRQVRYAMPWVRPPLEVYGLVPTFSQDGLEWIHNGTLGDWSAEWHSGLYRLGFDAAVSNSRMTNQVSSDGAFLNLSLRNGPTTIKLGIGYSQTSLESGQLDSLFAALRAFGGPDGADLAKDLKIDDSPTWIAAIGLRQENDQWLLVAELGLRTIEGFFRDQYGAYITLGRRFGPWMPYATAAKRWTDGPASDARAGFLDAEVRQLLASSRFDSTSYSLGLSYDLNTQAIVKFQVDRIQPKKDSWGLYTNHATNFDFRDPGTQTLFTLSVDFLF